MVEEIKIIQGPTGLFLSFPTKKQRDGTYWDIAFPANAETRRMIEQTIRAAYAKSLTEATSAKRQRKYLIN
jgi:stage V sporulation protein G